MSTRFRELMHHKWEKCSNGAFLLKQILPIHLSTHFNLILCVFIGELSGPCSGFWGDSPVCEESVSEVWQQGSWSGERGELADLAAEAPVLSERLLCGAKQVSAEQLSLSLEANTLNYSHLSSEAFINVKVIAQLAFRLPFYLFIFLSEEGFLPAKVPPSFSSQLVCLLSVL